MSALGGLGSPPGFGVLPEDITPCEVVEIAYWHGNVMATIIEVEPEGRYGKQRGWATVEQITDFEECDKRPRFEAGLPWMRKLVTVSHRSDGPAGESGA